MDYEGHLEAAAPQLRGSEMVDGIETDTAGPVADAPARNQRNRRLAVAAAILAALSLVWFLLSDGEETPPVDPASQAPTVSIVVPGRTTIQGTISANGTLFARREMPIGSAGEGGQVVRVAVEPGDWVGQGEVLAVVDRSVQTQQAASQAAQIQVAQADAALAQANLDRALRLVDRGFISKADVDRLRATRDAASARVRVARAQLGEIQARSNRLNIVAPGAGLVLERNVEPGQVVSAGSGVLFRMARGGEMELRAQLSETDLASLSTGQSAQVRPVGTDESFTGQIWQLSPVIDPASRLGTARIALAYDPALRPGGFATAIIQKGALTVPVLPESAVLSDDKGSFVYVVGPDSKVVRRPVTTGAVTGNGITIAGGLAGTERVVLRAGGFLAPGDLVKAKAVKWTPGQA